MAIVLSKGEWSRITQWTELDREDPEKAQRKELLKFLNENSKEMIKDWPNSIENINKRNEELRQARQQEAIQANDRFYRRYLKRQREDQERLMYSARDTMFKNKDAPKLLLSAVIETTVLKEREEQRKFKEHLRNKELEHKRRDDDEIIRKAKEWNDMLVDTKQKTFEKNKKYQKEILEQAHEIAERTRREYEKELNQQKIDNVKAKEEIEQIKQFEEEFNAAEKARIWSDMERAKLDLEARLKERSAAEAMDDKLMEAIKRAQCRQDKKRKEVEKQFQDEKLRLLETISRGLKTGNAARDAKEQAILDKAIKEKEAIANARLAAQKAKDERIKQERIQAREQFLKDEAQRIHEVHTHKQWELMNRFKNVELYDEFKEKLREEELRKMKQNKEDLIRQRQEREEREAKEKAETRYFYGELALRKMRDADNKLLTHAQQLIEEAKAHGRPDRPIRKAVERYCGMNRLYPMPPLPRSQQEHFGSYAPVDLTDSDPWYKEPPKPPVDLGPDADDEDELITNKSDAKLDTRNGLQERKPNVASKLLPEQGDLIEDNKQRQKRKQIRCQTANCDCDLNFHLN